MSDEQAVLQANQAFYTAFATRNIARMEQIWAHAATVCCIHPGWAPLVGRVPVIDSWATILSDPGAPEISCGDARAILHHQSALVTCYEFLPQSHLLASNFFVLENGAWHLVHHHASPGPQIAVASAMRPDGTVH